MAAPVRPVRVGIYVALLAGLTAVVTWSSAGGQTTPGRPVVAALPVLALLIGAAEYLQVRIRFGREVDGLNLVEAVMLPLVWAFPIEQVVVAVAAGQALAATVRRNDPLKSAFNIAQWSLVAATASSVVEAFGGRGLTAHNLLVLLAALGLAAVVNDAAFTGVLALTTKGRPVDVLRDIAGLVVPGWLGGLGLNAAIGLLYVLAYTAHPAAVTLFIVPLTVLHLAYRGQASAHSDRARLAGLHRAAASLTAPLDPRDAVSTYLCEVAKTFDARLVVLVLRVDGGREVHRLVRDSAGALPAAAEVSVEAEDTVTLAGALAALPGPVAVQAGASDPLSRRLAMEGGRDCLAAPLLDENRLLGALVVVDRQGVEGRTGGELAVVESLAREAAGAFTKGRLLSRVLDEQHKLAQIVSTTSDGIISVDEAGLVRSWNPAMERLTGLRADEMVAVPGALDRLDLRTTTGAPVALSHWPALDSLPTELRVVGPQGPRRLTCSYSRTDPRPDAEDETGALVVIARDISPVEEMEQLRQQFGRMVEQEAAQRVVVEHLQQAVMPPRPELPGLELGLSYVASDPSEPTGGDLYDCQLLPTGQLYLAVVDVLGHGVRATQDALAVIHTLRTVVLDGTPLQDVVAKADLLLGRRDPDLVATVVLALYEPATGELVVASGGHPPALVVTAGGAVAQLTATGGAIGWPGAGSESLASAVLSAGDTLVLYTDGLVEAGKDIVAGLASLAVNAHEVASLPAPELATMLVETSLAGAERRDDTLALVLRRAPTAADGSSDRASWHLGTHPHLVGPVRRAATAWLGQRGVPTQDAAMVMGELLANAVVAARDGVELELGLTDSGVQVVVTDDGPGFDEAAPRPPGQDRGRGLEIVRRLAGEVSVESGPAGTTVRAALDRARQPAAG